MSFGSDGLNDVPIPDVYGLAARHFSIGPNDGEEGEFVVEASEADAVVEVNGTPTKRCVLHNGDEVVAARLKVVFHSDRRSEIENVPPLSTQSASPVAAPAIAPAPAEPGTPPVLDFGGSPAPVAAAAAGDPAVAAGSKTADGSGRKKLRMALATGIALAVLVGGVFAAQRTGVLDYAFNAAPEDHFDFMKANIPSGFDAYMTGDISRMIAAYPEIAANSGEQLPPLDFISQQLRQQAGFQITGIDKISVVVDSPTAEEMKSNKPPRFIATVSMKDVATLRAMTSHLREKSAEQDFTKLKFGPRIMLEVQPPQGDKLMAYFPRGRHFMVGDVESMTRLMTEDADPEGRLNELARNAGGMLAMTIDVEAFAPVLSYLPGDANLDGMRSLSASLDFGSTVKATCVADFKSETDSQSFVQNMKSAEWMGHLSQEEEIPGLDVVVKGPRATLRFEQDLAELQKQATLVDTNEFGEVRPQ